MIYFMGPEDLTLVKIGHTINMESRMQIHRTTIPVKIVVHGVMPGSYQDEQRLHRRFKAHHSHGEWFHLTPGIREYIATNSTPYIPPVKHPVQRSNPFAYVHSKAGFYLSKANGLRRRCLALADNPRLGTTCAVSEAMTRFAEAIGYPPPPDHPESRGIITTYPRPEPARDSFYVHANEEWSKWLVGLAKSRDATLKGIVYEAVEYLESRQPMC
jgi:hypothetical protein